MKRKKIIFYSVILFLITLSFLTMLWGNKNFSAKSMSQIVFHLKAPMEGSDPYIYVNWFVSCVPYSLMLNIVIFYGMLYLYNNKNETYKTALDILKKSFYVYFTGVLCFALFNYHIFSFIGQLTSDDIFYEAHYVDPQSVNVIFPNEQRNIIHIYLESFESTYSNIQNGGAYEEDKIKELTSLANEYIHFSNNDKLGGSLTLEGTQWTIASMVSQSAGIPLSLPFDSTEYEDRVLLSGAFTLGEILEDQGYNQVLMKGSDANFAFTSNYYMQGNYEIIDYPKMIELGMIEEDYKVFWGVEDRKLIEFAKQKLLALDDLNEPFNFEMVTVDTHAPDGYLCDSCQKSSDVIYDDVLACQSKQISEFVSWIQEQSFYDNTTIIINGDHNNMSSEYFKDISKDYVRTPYNVIINAVNSTENTNNRLFSSIDWFPTILSSIGVMIEGDQLGLGVNLFSDKKTLIEEYGFNYVNKLIQKNSSFYNHVLLENPIIE